MARFPSKILLFIFIFFAQQAHAQNREGAWQGYLDVGRISFRIALTLRTDASGAVTAGSFNNIDDGIYDAPLRHLMDKSGRLYADLDSGEKFEIEFKKGILQGRYTQASGSFQNAGVISPFRLTRGGDFLIPGLSADGSPQTLYIYHPPKPLKDGWVTEDWQKAGLDIKPLQDGLQKVIDGTYPHIHSVQVAYRGRLVLDEYFYGYGPADFHPLQSETKSVFSALIGIANDQRRMGLDEKLYDFFPEFRNQSGWTDNKNRITLRDLLTMTSGFACNDWTAPLACSWAMVHSSDWLSFILGEPVDAEPGSRFSYCGACLLPLSALLEKRSGLSVPDFAQKYLWDPLGIKQVKWFSGPQGVIPASFGLQMRPRDFLKLGVLYLDQGVWKGRKVISPEWITQSTGLQIPKSQTNGKNDYGYLWWERDVPAPERGGTVRAFFAWGVGGQYLFVVPSLQMVCLVTGGNYKDSRLGANSFKLFQENLLAAVSKPNHPDGK
jgi:CubicO group peptidase (beta-lactamase class C family)